MRAILTGENKMVGGTTMMMVLERGGFIRDTDLPALVESVPDMMVLIRCGCGRYTCRMDQVSDQVKTIEEGTDYVRDVCLIADNHDRIENGMPYLKAKCVIAH